MRKEEDCDYNSALRDFRSATRFSEVRQNPYTSIGNLTNLPPPEAAIAPQPHPSIPFDVLAYQPAGQGKKPSLAIFAHGAPLTYQTAAGETAVVETSSEWVIASLGPQVGIVRLSLPPGFFIPGPILTVPGMPNIAEMSADVGMPGVTLGSSLAA